VLHLPGKQADFFHCTHANLAVLKRSRRIRMGNACLNRLFSLQFPPRNGKSDH
jgi:hypothetical protein